MESDQIRRVPRSWPAAAASWQRNLAQRVEYTLGGCMVARVVVLKFCPLHRVGRTSQRLDKCVPATQQAPTSRS